LQAFKSSLGFGANRDLLAGVVDPAGGAFFLIAGDGGTDFLASLISILTVLLVLVLLLLFLAELPDI